MEQAIVVLTGGARGIGRASALRLARDGYAVHILDLLADPLADVLAQARDERLPITGAAVDVTRREDVEHALADLRRVDVVVAAHGVILVKPFEQTGGDEFDRILRINVTGTAVVFRACLARMTGGGKMIAFASRGVLGDTNTAAYIASKAAVVGLVRALAFEFRSRNIAVNAIAPGFTDTDMVRDHLGAERLAAAAKLEPRGHAAHPDEIAQAVAFLADPRTTFITGQTLFVDGGKSLGGLAAPV